MKIDKCKICNREFKNLQGIATHLRYKHKNISSKDYYDKYLKKDNEGICKCGKETTFLNLNIGYFKNCSTNCAKKGIKLSQEHKDKIGLGNKGKKYSQETRDKMSENHVGNKGIKHSQEAKDKMSNVRKGIKFSQEHKDKISLATSGDKNPMWKGGISCEPYCSAWTDKEYKADLKERDNNKCQNPDCWGTSKILCLHHIDYDKKNCSPDNLITLCTSCNARANKNREWHTKFYNNIIKRKWNDPKE